MVARKTALVTGAGGGIGKACALALALEGHAIGVLGRRIENCRQTVDEIEAAGGRAMALQADIADRAQVQDSVEKLRAAFGPITILVNNAGVSSFVAFEELSDRDWERVFDVNCKGTFIVTQIVLPDMKAAKFGRIINISSSSAQTGSADQVHYSASKGAMISLTRSLAQALGPYGVTVNNIPPGAVLGTTMSEELLQRLKMPPDALKHFIPVRRTGVPDDVASACVWLSSEHAGYVTGQTIGVNGGRVTS